MAITACRALRAGLREYLTRFSRTSEDRAAGPGWLAMRRFPPRAGVPAPDGETSWVYMYRENPELVIPALLYQAKDMHANINTADTLGYNCHTAYSKKNNVFPEIDDATKASLWIDGEEHIVYSLWFHVWPRSSAFHTLSLARPTRSLKTP